MRIYSPYRCVIIIVVILSLSSCACGVGSTTKKGLLINAETERPIDISACNTIYEEEVTMEEIQEGKRLPWYKHYNPTFFPETILLSHLRQEV
jgi:type IV pilus biogenesis protein CpaD/CtpE